MLQPLREIFPPDAHPELLVGLDRADDAAVYRLNEQQAIVTTTDFFPPVVDDPYDFGAIAAANAMSDIYAMGARVLFAVNLVAFPSGLDRSLLREILRGGAEKVREAGGVVAGGHSVEDREPKYGLAVTGLIDPKRVLRKGGAQVGDRLFLTKALGTGIVTTALKQEIARDEDVEAAVESMKRLNRAAAAAALATGATGMTDITGFGLLGHAREMAVQAGVDFHIELGQLQWLPGARAYAEADAFPGGMERNRQFYAPTVDFVRTETLQQRMLWTPETSGGLLVAVPPEAAGAYRARVPEARAVGHVAPGKGVIHVKG